MQARLLGNIFLYIKKTTVRYGTALIICTSDFNKAEKEQKVQNFSDMFQKNWYQIK